jgi:transcriptional regulator with XRE-family HTH domain
MGWIESKRPTTDQLVEAIRSLRDRLGDTQESFAARLGLSKRAVANYEKDRRPTAGALVRLARLASDADMGRETTTFMLELGEDLGLKEIKGGVMSHSHSTNPKGYMLIHLDSREAIEFASAFFQRFRAWQQCTGPDKQRARRILKKFAVAPTEEEE